MIHQKNKYLVLISDFNISPLTISIIKSFGKAEVEIELFLLGNNNEWLQERLKHLDINYQQIDRVGKKQLPKLFIFFMRKQLFGEYGGVYASGQFASTIAITSAWISRTNKRIFTRHHSDENHIIENFRFSLFRAHIADLLVNRLSTVVIAVSPAVKELLVNKEGVRTAKVRQINNGVEISKLLDLREKQSSSNLLTIGIMSRMTHVKGVEYTVKAFVEFIKLHPNSKLLIVGAKSSSYPKIMSYLKDISESKFQFIEKIDDNSDFFSMIDVFVHAPIRKYAEAFGLVYLEAISAGKVCIFTESGILLNDNNLARLYSRVEYRSSKDILEKLKVAAVSRRESLNLNFLENDFSLNTMEEKYSKLWQEI
jgi:glycosyltransferase involved in cell wall biosynthesis